MANHWNAKGVAAEFLDRGSATVITSRLEADQLARCIVALSGLQDLTDEVSTVWINRVLSH